MNTPGTTSPSAKMEDEENPSIDLDQGIGSSRQERSIEPCFGATATAIVVNAFGSFAAVYAVTGRAKYAQCALLASLPVTTFLWLLDADRDFDRWRATKIYREKKIPEQMIPDRPKYNWTNYEARMLEGRARAAGLSDSDQFTG